MAVGSPDVAILGAGPAGLAAAYRLAQRGLQVEVLEREARPGGLAASFEVAGVRVDHGSHRLHRTCAPEILSTLRGLLGDDLQRRERNGRILLDGAWIGFPPRASDLARNLSPRLRVGLARDLASAPFRRVHEDTFRDVVRARLGPTMADEFYVPYARKLWGIDAAALSGELARRRVSASSGLSLLRRLRSRDPDARAFFSPRRGFGQIVERLADAAVDAGASIRLESSVTSVGSHRVVTTAGDIHAEHVLSTLPLPVLARLAAPPAAPDVLAAAAALQYRAIVLLYVVLAQPRFTEYDAHYFPGPEVTASRVSEPKNYRDGRGVDPEDRTVLCAEIPCDEGDATWNASPESLAEQLMEELAVLGVPHGRVIGAETRRIANGYPVYDLGFEAARAQLEGWARFDAGVVTFGRQGLFAHDNTHHALATGWAVAAAFDDDGRFDSRRWAASRESFHTHVVED